MLLYSAVDLNVYDVLAIKLAQLVVFGSCSISRDCLFYAEAIPRIESESPHESSRFLWEKSQTGQISERCVFGNPLAQPAGQAQYAAAQARRSALPQHECSALINTHPINPLLPW
jgi:hypothetical protein